MNYSIFQSPRDILYGQDTVNLVGEKAIKFGKKVMIITGKHSSKKTGALDKVLDSLKKIIWIL